MPQLVEFLHCHPRLVDSADVPEAFEGGQSPRLDQPVKGALRARRPGARQRRSVRKRGLIQGRIAEADPVKNNLELAPGNLAGFKLLDCPSGQIARVGKRRLTRLLALAVDALKLG